ncbi:hypothetical protein PVOR_14679 [Paenibacillus vortex V453]|uniref:Uncharacterized protein n=1 Tax=Paenibacillus vortex V453 TaxID=715225 RepID=A0A2R9SV99_9BACL|nr:hypothetical protein PVOR_14679 [Paenibacillus vortex V453]
MGTYGWFTVAPSHTVPPQPTVAGSAFYNGSDP